MIAQQHDREDTGQRERETGRQEELGSEAQYDMYCGHRTPAVYLVTLSFGVSWENKEILQRSN